MDQIFLSPDNSQKNFQRKTAHCTTTLSTTNKHLIACGSAVRPWQLRNYGIPEKLATLLEDIQQETECSKGGWRIDRMGPNIRVTVGVRQGRNLSPYLSLSNLILEATMQALIKCGHRCERSMVKIREKFCRCIGYIGYTSLRNHRNGHCIDHLQFLYFVEICISLSRTYFIRATATSSIKI